MQVIIRNLWYGQNIKEAIDSSRIHHQLYPMAFIYESAFPQVRKRFIKCVDCIFH